jgi:hypothetical protein
MLRSAARHARKVAKPEFKPTPPPPKDTRSWTEKIQKPMKVRLAGAWKGYEAPTVDPNIIERTAKKMLQRPDKAALMLANLPDEDRRAVALSWALTELEEEFAKADQDRDGKLSFPEFRNWAMKVIETGQKRAETPEPSRMQLYKVAFTTCVPFIAFGCVDNGLMVIYGDMIDGTLGVMFGCSMLASAALGNAISNIFGMISHGTIIKWAGNLGLPDPHLTLSQRKLPKVHFWSTFGSTVGVFSGCLLGMTPLLFMDQTKKEEERNAAKH